MDLRYVFIQRVNTDVHSVRGSEYANTTKDERVVTYVMDLVYAYMKNERINVYNARVPACVYIIKLGLNVAIAEVRECVVTVTNIDVILNISLYARNATTTRIQTPSKSVTTRSKSEQL